MDSRLLTFVAVVEKRSFSRAAEVMHMTQPAVSLHIRALENEYGVKLLDRSTKQVRLTQAGNIVYRRAKLIERQYREMRRLLEDLMESETGSLAIGASYTFGEYVLPHVIAGFCRRYPRIQPTVWIENTRRVAERIAERELDVGIVEGDLDHPELHVEPFRSDSMVVIVPASHRLSDRLEVDARDLEEETWIVREVGSGTREMTDRLWKQAGILPETRMEFSSTQVIKESVEAGLGIALVSEVSIRKELALGTLKALRVKDHPVNRKFSMVLWPDTIRPKAVDLFIQYLSGNGQV